MDAWQVPNAARKYGGAFTREQKASTDDTGNMVKAAGPAPAAAHPALDAHNPLLWFGVLAAATVGLMAYSTTVRVGPVSAAVKVGK